jgi:transitional endoplasmic reticulum ATPase
MLAKGFSIEKKYEVSFSVKQSYKAETYRVKGIDGKSYFLKLFSYINLHRSSFDHDNNLLEIELLKKIKHPSTASYIDSGEIIFENKKYAYVVLDFISGETLFNRISREPISTLYDTKQIIMDVLSGLNYLHTLPEPIIHNEISPQNIMLDLSRNIPKAKIIDFGYARLLSQPNKAYNREGLNLNYVASECFNNVFSPQSDIYSVGALMYMMLFGMPPWSVSISPYQARGDVDDLILNARKQALHFPNLSGRIVDFDESILPILEKSLAHNTNDRFQSAKEFMKALKGETEIHSEVKQIKKVPNTEIKKEKGKGFAAIAGMNHLKEELKNDVIDVIQNPEEYKKHHLGFPNGMLLYGPPGCGKTFFAERFAEETGYHFMKVISSDIASIYVHGTQEKIGKIFKEAKEKAPTILYFDELDAMTPDRNRTHNSSQSGEVNEFLSQLDNIGDSGVFVVGSTNKPDLIDKAIVRSGRLEKHFYIPPPDFEARKAMFELYLKDRPIDPWGIDYSHLANLTENYVSSDIKKLIDDTSRKAIKDKGEGKRNDTRITMDDLEFIIKNQKPTLSLSDLNEYERIKQRMNNEVTNENPRPRIGFR